MSREIEVPGDSYEAALVRERVARRAAEAQVEALTVALEFYADPETYFGIGIFPDHPCGEFYEDISEVPWPDGGTNYKPGKRAREALSRVSRSEPNCPECGSGLLNGEHIAKYECSRRSEPAPPEGSIFAEGDARCGSKHTETTAVCLLPAGHDGPHRNTQGYWSPLFSSAPPVPEEQQ